MWNYSFVIPSVLMMITLLVFFLGRQRLPIRMNRTFLGLLFIHLCVVFFDLLSSSADENYTMYSPGALYALNTLFFVFFLARVLWFYRFTLDVLGRRFSALFFGLSCVPFAVGEVFCLSSFATGAVFRIQDGMYRRGPCYDVIYVCCFFYCALSVALLLARRRALRFQAFAGALGFNVVLLVGYVARILFPNYLIMNTFCIIAIMIIYLAFLNPDLYLTERGPAFNMRGFTTILGEYHRRKRYRILAFSLLRYSHERSILSGGQMDVAIVLINQYLYKSFGGLLPFYLRGGRFALIGPEDAPWEDIRRQIDERFQHAWQTETSPLYLNVRFASISSKADLETPDRVINTLILALEKTTLDQDAAGQTPEADIQEIDWQIETLKTLERAIEQNAVEVFLQPVVDSHTLRVVAAEALARIRDEQGRVIPPGEFIPIAEKVGLINRLGEQVFEKTCAFIHDHGLSALGLEWINVNLSPIQCAQRNLASRLKEILERYDVPAQAVHLEITEQSMVDFSLLRKQIQELRDAGFQFVLDDYGSGYSNLTRVKHYPFINIKLDMEVVWDYFRDRDSLLPTIVQGFRQMGFSITAEGIETTEMAELLTGIGCDYLQGYLFSSPLPTDDFIEQFGGRK